MIMSHDPVFNRLRSRISRDDVLNLINEKDKIENEIKEFYAFLDSNHVGMDEPLVDADGFPRNDIDVYQVRHARHRIICLKNDMKDIMKQIEKGLHELHASERTSHDDNHQDISSNLEEELEPIARITMVSPGSPAETCGFKADDLILQFGSVNMHNFASVANIGQVVQHSVNRKVEVLVQRQGLTTRLSLTPRIWAGRGFFGCNIVPIEAIER